MPALRPREIGTTKSCQSCGPCEVRLVRALCPQILLPGSVGGGQRWPGEPSLVPGLRDTDPGVQLGSGWPTLLRGPC